MQNTDHQVIIGSAAKMIQLDSNFIDLVVTSPPYPMINMWDELFCSLNPSITANIIQQYPEIAFEKMHELLDQVWQELYRVLKNGAFICINIGDAIRTINNQFRLYPNHARIQNSLAEIGFNPLPLIVWRKPANSPNKFMGSGMLPAGAYITLEHEYIIIARKGDKRNFCSPGEKERRMKSAYFWEERNSWFSDLWEIKGARQEDGDPANRRRSAAYPFEIPFRLLNMFSLIGDKVLDPFLGTGTTSLAAIITGRNSWGYEVDSSLLPKIAKRLLDAPNIYGNYNNERLNNHYLHVQNTLEQGKSLKYYHHAYKFPVKTRQETKLTLPRFSSLQQISAHLFRAVYD